MAARICMQLLCIKLCRDDNRLVPATTHPRVRSQVQLAAAHQLRAVVIERDEVVGALDRTARVGQGAARL